MKKFLEKINIWPLLLVVISVILCTLNYTPNTWLSGWDTLQPELNFPLAFKRIFSGVWRFDQGLGAVAIQSHMADLPRVIYLWIASFLLPLSFLRYSYFFLMLILGPLGIYFLLSKLLSREEKEVCKISSFLAAVVYLFNLGTLQHFVVPLEMFATLFGLLPWLFLLTLSLLGSFTRRKLILFCLLNFLASSMAHTATLFYVYFLFYIIFLLIYALTNLKSLNVSIKRGIILLILTLSINSYWLIPNIYAVKEHGSEVQNSKINQLFTPEAITKNQVFGNLKDAPILKNFLFDWQLYNYQSRQFVPVLGSWQNHFKKPLVLFIGYGIFIFSLWGIFSAIRRKEKKFLPFLVIYLFSFLFSLNGAVPITLFLEKMGKAFSLLTEALRFPFTKFSIFSMLGLSAFFGLGIAEVVRLLKKIRFLKYVFVVVLFSLFVYYFLPAFSGNFIQPAMRIAFPKEYFEMFSWFDKQERSKRVAILPAQTFWNWVYYSWGYQGAGFLQFGIPQPILDRDYNRWSVDNEQYFREMSYALYSQNPKIIKQVLIKFRIDFILWDTNILNVGGVDNETLNWQISRLLSETGMVSQSVNFGENIKVFSVLQPEINAHEDLPLVNTKIIGWPEDIAYAALGPYFTKLGKNEEINKYRSLILRNERIDISGLNLKLIKQVSFNKENLQPLGSCGSKKLFGERNLVGKVLVYKSENNPICDHFLLSGLLHDEAYAIEFESKNISGFPLQIYVTNNLTGHNDLVIYLHQGNKSLFEAFLLPPLFDFGLGYTININNFAVNKTKTTNEIQAINVYKVNWNEFSLQFLSGQIEEQKGVILVNNQSFEKGWRAYSLSQKFGRFFAPIFGKEIKEHVLVNNWENGWVLPKDFSGEIVIVFLPQYLEYGGFCLMTVGFFLIIFWRKRGSLSLKPIF